MPLVLRTLLVKTPGCKTFCGKNPWLQEPLVLRPLVVFILVIMPLVVRTLSCNNFWLLKPLDVRTPSCSW